MLGCLLEGVHVLDAGLLEACLVETVFREQRVGVAVLDDEDGAKRAGGLSRRHADG